MKQCPNCKQTFTDDTSFCLMDGTPLVTPESFETQDFSTETPTIVASRIPTSPTVSNPKQTSVPNWIYPVLGLLIGLVVVFGFLAFYALMIKDKDNNKSASTNVSKKQTEDIEGMKPDRSIPDIRVENEPDQPTPDVKKEPTPDVKKEPTPDQPTPDVKKEKTPAPTPKPKPKIYGKTRIKFARGAISSRVSGGIDKNGKRTYVLKAIAGQYLSATVNSNNNCVVFANQSSSIGFVTRRGDNQVELYNKCDPTNFRLTVTIR